MTQLLKIHNDFIQQSFAELTGKEDDLLISLFYFCQTKDGSEPPSEITLPFSTIKEIIQYKGKNNERFIADLVSMNKKLLQVPFCITDGPRIVQFVAFSRFVTDPENQTLTVKLSEDFAYLVKDLATYTALEVAETVALKSWYAKQIYKRLRQFRSTGKWVVTLEEFRDYLGIKSYSNSMTDQRIIKPSLDELKEFFPGLRCKKIMEKEAASKSGGRPKLHGYEWTFKPQFKPQEKAKKETKKQAKKQLSQEDIASIAGWIKTPRYCPKCNRPIFSKLVKNEKGEYLLFGHTDYKTGDCQFATTDFSELLEKHQLESKEDAALPEEIAKEAEAQIKKIRELTSKIGNAK